MKSVYLLGANTKYELVFGKIILRPIKYYDSSKRKYIEDKTNMQLSISFYAVELLSKEENDKKRKDAEEYCDLYLLNEAIKKNKSLYFKVCYCGQFDTRAYGMLEYTSEEAYNVIHDLWDNYHLEVIGKDEVKQIMNIIKIFVKIDESAWLNDFLERYKKEFCIAE